MIIFVLWLHLIFLLYYRSVNLLTKITYPYHTNPNNNIKAWLGHIASLQISYFAAFPEGHVINKPPLL